MSALPKRHHTAETALVVVASQPIAAGALIAGSDLTLRRWPAGIRPPGAFAAAASLSGRRAAGPIGIDEPVTKTRLVDDSLTRGLAPGLAAVPVTITGTAALIHSGDYVDVIDPPADATAAPLVLAERVLVLAVLPTTEVGSADAATELLVAGDRATELRLSSAAARRVLASLRSPP